MTPHKGQRKDGEMFHCEGEEETDDKKVIEDIRHVFYVICCVNIGHLADLYVNCVIGNIITIPFVLRMGQ